jgi:hypothetical protein
VNVRNTKQQVWSEGSMRSAVDEVTEGQGKRRLLRSGYLKSGKTNPNQKMYVSSGPKQTVFSTSEKEELATYLKVAEGRLSVFTQEELRNLAFQLAKKKKKKGKEKKMENVILLTKKKGTEVRIGFVP